MDVDGQPTLEGNNKFIGGDGVIAWYWVIVALAAGVFIGWLLCALCVVSRDAEQAPERRPH